MRHAVMISAMLVSACSSQQPEQNPMITLDGTGGATVNGNAAVAAPTNGASAGSANTVQLVDAEGPKLEPIGSAMADAAGLATGSCRFSPAQGALPVLIASRTGGKTLIAATGRQIDMQPSGPVGQTGGSFTGQGGASATISAQAPVPGAAGSSASLQLRDADGPAFTYRDGFWACN